MANRKCVACGNQLTGDVASLEHVLSQWLATEIEIPGARLKHYLHDSIEESDELLRSHGLNKFAVRSVCDKCNSGWMCRLENRAKPFIHGLMNAQMNIRDLEPEAKLIVARWAVKTAFMLLSVQQACYELPWGIFQRLAKDEASGPEGCFVLAAQISTLPDGFTYVCHPNILAENESPVQFRVGFSIQRLHLVVIIPVRDGQHVLRFDSRVHLSLWPPTVAWIQRNEVYPPGFDSVAQLQEFLTGLVEAGISG